FEEGCRVASPNWRFFLARRLATVTRRVTAFPLRACREWGGGPLCDGVMTREIVCPMMARRQMWDVSQARRLQTQRSGAAEQSGAVEPQSRAEGGKGEA